MRRIEIPDNILMEASDFGDGCSKRIVKLKIQISAENIWGVETRNVLGSQCASSGASNPWRRLMCDFTGLWIADRTLG